MAREDTVLAREQEPRPGEDRQHAPADRAPAAPEPPQRAGAILPLEHPRHRDGDEDEGDGAADPDGGCKHVQSGDCGLHCDR
jgi:hypothetical protein